MAKSIKRVIGFFLFMLCGLILNAQNPEQSEMDKVMRSDGKIYVVLAVLAVVLLGMFAYLFYTERKLDKLEKEIKSEKE